MSSDMTGRAFFPQALQKRAFKIEFSRTTAAKRAL